MLLKGKPLSQEGFVSPLPQAPAGFPSRTHSTLQHSKQGNQGTERSYRSDRQSAWRTTDRGSWHCTGGSDQEKEKQKGKMVVWGGLTNSCEEKWKAKEKRKDIPISFEKTLMVGKIEGGRRRGWQDEMVGWHHRLNGPEFEQTPGDSEGQGSLVSCCPWYLEESDLI